MNGQNCSKRHLLETAALAVGLRRAENEAHALKKARVPLKPEQQHQLDELHAGLARTVNGPSAQAPISESEP